MVPNSWKATELGEIAKFSSGGTPSKENEDFWGGIHPWITAKDLKQHYLENSIDTLTDAGFANAKTAPADASLILVRGMTLLKDFPVGYATRPLSFNQDIKALVPLKGLDGLFLSFLLVSQKEKIRQLVSIAGHGTGRLDTESIKSFPVNLPILGEQKKIAKILSTWDQAITTTEKLLANSQQQKKALMQQLLTGKKRFPSFKDQWRTVCLGKVGQIASAGVDKKINHGEQKVRLLNFLDVFRREFIFDEELTQWVTAPSSKVLQCNVKKGDIFFTPSSETRDELAISSVSAEDMGNVVYSYHVVRFRLNGDWDFNFRAYAFQSEDFKRQAYRLGDGSGQRYVISQTNFRNMVVRVPSLPEQKLIGDALLAASKEILVLQQKLVCLKQEKKALMQQLLTGKRRVKVEES
jgi:type I restriction enzyme S subunit